MIATPALTPRQKFLSEKPGRFRVGHVFHPAGDELDDGGQFAAQGIGYWRCEITDDNRLTWDDKVYELFGLPPGITVDRQRAVERYSDGAREALERVRSFSIRNHCGFILDVAMGPEAGAPRMRVLSVPVIADGELVALHGLKRAI